MAPVTSGRDCRAAFALTLRNGKRKRKTAPPVEKNMEVSSQPQVSHLLRRWSEGDSAALDQLTPLIYQELRRMARRYMGQQPTGHTLQTTALIHEAYLRLVGREEKHWENRAHFFGVAAQAMRHILVDYARARGAAKRGGAARTFSLERRPSSPTARGGVVALDERSRTRPARAPTSAWSSCLLRRLEREGRRSVEDFARR